MVSRHGRDGDVVVYICGCTTFAVVRPLDRTDPDLDEALWQKYTNANIPVLFNARLIIGHGIFTGVRCLELWARWCLQKVREFY